MKKYLLFLMIAPVFFGCSKDENSDEVKGIQAKVYGKEWNTLTCQALWLNKSISISGIASDGSSVVISLNDTIEKEYTIVNQTSLDQSTAAYTPKDSVTYTTVYNSASGGVVSITNINKKDSTVSGTFNLTLHRANSNKVTLTDGVFKNIPYKKEVSVVFDNTFSSTIAGTAWSPTTIVGTKTMGIILINATSNGQKTMGISVPGSIVAGSYDFTSFGDYSLTYSEGTNTYTANSGSLTVKSHNTTTKRIEGTFSTIVVNFVNASLTKTVTGSFAVTY